MDALMAYDGVPEGKWIAGPFSMFVIGIFTFMMIFHKEMPFGFMYPFLLIFWTVFPLVIFGFAVWKYLIGFYLIGVPLLRIFAPRIPGLKRISEGVSSNVSYSGGSGWSSSSGYSGFSGGGGSFGVVDRAVHGEARLHSARPARGMVLARRRRYPIRGPERGTNGL